MKQNFLQKIGENLLVFAASMDGWMKGSANPLFLVLTFVIAALVSAGVFLGTMGEGIKLYVQNVEAWRKRQEQAS